MNSGKDKSEECDEQVARPDAAFYKSVRFAFFQHFTFFLHLALLLRIPLFIYLFIHNARKPRHSMNTISDTSASRIFQRFSIKIFFKIRGGRIRRTGQARAKKIAGLRGILFTHAVGSAKA